jgi:hypothetical protein
MTVVQPYKFFKDTFGLKLNEYLDTELSVVSKKPILDLYKFEEWLQSKHDINEDESIEDVLLQHYGKAVTEQIRDMI